MVLDLPHILILAAGCSSRMRGADKPVIAAFRERKALLPSQHSIEKIGIAARAVARRRAESALIS
uniref:hypothetical protein n=1 Tax=Shinella zoogloeoides TaxID=352475 RepID=UPI0019697504